MLEKKNLVSLRQLGLLAWKSEDLGRSFWQSATSGTVRRDGSRFFSQEHSGKHHELQQGKFLELNIKRKNTQQDWNITGTGAWQKQPWKYSKLNMTNSEQSDVTFEIRPALGRRFGRTISRGLPVLTIPQFYDLLNAAAAIHNVNCSVPYVVDLLKHV